MSTWTPDQSRLLSLLLDSVVGTEYMVHMIQDSCKIYDCLSLSIHNANVYFTGSKSEGLNLPGSDEDYMFDINDVYDIQVIPASQNAQFSVNTTLNLFVMSTENVSPCFTMLRNVGQRMCESLFNSCQYIDDTPYLSSYLYMHNLESEYKERVPNIRSSRQGPAIEGWSFYMHTSESGTDHVPSIRCSFWPDTALEWTLRLRRSGWPSQCDIKSIIDFGFHLVPVGNPLSDRYMMEWRISFSVAERTLAWSFNHVQMQCYAVLKIILKQFIKIRCRPQFQVLCSYFIKTFLFWKYEETDPTFWCKENLRDCIMYLLSGFRDCIALCTLRHYFIREFNLFSIKMTAAVRVELLKIFDVILRSDIRIMQDCESLRDPWFQCLNAYSPINIKEKIMKNCLVESDYCFIDLVFCFMKQLIRIGKSDFFARMEEFVRRSSHLTCKTEVMTAAVRISLFRASLQHICQTSRGNKTSYLSHRFLRNNGGGFDISTCRLWYAMLMSKSCNYRLSLRIINKVLSSIPNFVLCYSHNDSRRASNDAKCRYAEMLFPDNRHVTERAKEAWMTDLLIKPDDMDIVPAAIQVELLHCEKELGVYLSPFVCSYYLMFLDYCGLCQSDNRNYALRQLLDVVNNPDQLGFGIWHSLNIAGHCLLSVGKTQQARDMFIRSYQYTLPYLQVHQYNSAKFYLQCLQQ